MNIEDVKTIEELAEFMDAEAALWGRTDQTSPTVNGAGIRQQWQERINFPYAVFYLLSIERKPDENSPSEIAVNITAMYFDEDGNKTERPERKDERT